MKKKKIGGKREGAGRKTNYNEPSNAIIFRRVPERHVTAINALIDTYMRPFENIPIDNQKVTIKTKK